MFLVADLAGVRVVLVGIGEPPVRRLWPKVLNVAEGDPLYVIKLDAANKRVIVGPKEALVRTQFSIRDANWLTRDHEGVEVTVKLRSAHKGVPAIIAGNHVTLINPEDAGAVAPGQACVAYMGERVLGGGWIVN